MNANELFSLEGKVALITGASKGIGEAIAHFYANAGAKLIINSRNQDELDKVATAISASGAACTGIAANTGDMHACKMVELTFW